MQDRLQVRKRVNRQEFDMYRMVQREVDAVCVSIADTAPIQPVLATSPLEAMNMAGGDKGANVLPITVTITLTTVLWPGKAH